ncbi:hypothetical protein [Kordia jejudonensis]|uniref:hypothetical protein n=1 Tax=Kordia jejudonensis TaxID=1348245 RepID=UPI00062925F3|nr:hypothetical protein [Kordia jejudonensis]
MKRKKKTLKFNKIRIANMNFIKGGTDTNNDSVLHACQSGTNCPPPTDVASTPENPCSDGCATRGFDNHSLNQLACFNISDCNSINNI